MSAFIFSDLLSFLARLRLAIFVKIIDFAKLLRFVHEIMAIYTNGSVPSSRIAR
ncbi:hypothetical protein C8R30_12047 [Nitrosomonas nitrosa]|nr:hypothetical protein C8R30_12047 [Nitrosomonas nitrosa]